MKLVHKSVNILLAVMFVIGLSQAVTASEAKININTATKEELVTLKYVGDKIADRIIEFRKAQPFETIEEIMQVKGVGQKLYDANKDMITVKSE